MFFIFVDFSVILILTVSYMLTEIELSTICCFQFVWCFEILVINWISFFKQFSESGEMCAMKEAALVSDDAKSKESAKQLMQVSTFNKVCHLCFFFFFFMFVIFL